MNTTIAVVSYLIVSTAIMLAVIALNAGSTAPLVI